MDALPGPYLAVSGAVALVVAAVALTTTGLFRALGPAGIGLAALLFIVLGNPGSGNASAPELLPGFWRVTGQLLPPGAGGQAIRDTAYFDGHALARPALVLAAWALLGAALAWPAAGPRSGRAGARPRAPNRGPGMTPRGRVAPHRAGRIVAARPKGGPARQPAAHVSPGRSRQTAGLIPYLLTGWDNPTPRCRPGSPAPR